MIDGAVLVQPGAAKIPRHRIVRLNGHLHPPYMGNRIKVQTQFVYRTDFPSDYPTYSYILELKQLQDC